MDAAHLRPGGVATPDSGDFAALLRQRGLYPQTPNAASFAGGGPPAPLVQTQATTILAFKYADGVLVDLHA